MKQLAVGNWQFAVYLESNKLYCIELLIIDGKMKVTVGD